MRLFGAVVLPAVLLVGTTLNVSGQQTAAKTAAGTSAKTGTPVSSEKEAPAAAAAEAGPATPVAGQLSETDLGNVLAAIGLKPTRTEQRYDFAFKTSYRGEEWKFSMSAVLSRNGESVWVMAWLDQIPAKASEVPRTALLRLLAANDRLGNGKFFAYIPTNKRFVLQRIVRNEDMSSRKMMEILQDLAASVAEEYPTWAVSNWASKSEQQVADEDTSGRAVPQNPTAASKSAVPAATRTSEAASKFEGKQIR